MANVRVMPASDKYTHVQDDMRRLEFVPGFIEDHLGKTAATEYRRLCESGIEPIPEEASFEDKFELAYKNWMWVGGTAFGFVREHMDERGLEAFLTAEVESFKRATPGLLILMLNVIRAISPGTAFSMLAKQQAYLQQWMVPGATAEVSKDRMVITIDHCKVLDYPKSEDVCRLGCQQVAPRFMADLLKVKGSFERQGYGCTGTVTPLH